VFHVRNLSKTYGTGEAAVHALAGVDLDFSVVAGALPYLWKGFRYTLELTATAAAGATAATATAIATSFNTQKPSPCVAKA
jgi:ABC-type amino acid transport system permease subunit